MCCAKSNLLDGYGTGNALPALLRPQDIFRRLFRAMASRRDIYADADAQDEATSIPSEEEPLLADEGPSNAVIGAAAETLAAAGAAAPGGAAAAAAAGRVRFEPGAAAPHAYLGPVSDLARGGGVSGYLEEGTAARLPLLPLPGEILL